MGEGDRMGRVSGDEGDLPAAKEQQPEGHPLYALDQPPRDDTAKAEPARREGADDTQAARSNEGHALIEQLKRDAKEADVPEEKLAMLTGATQRYLDGIQRINDAVKTGDPDAEQARQDKGQLFRELTQQWSGILDPRSTYGPED